VAVDKGEAYKIGELAVRSATPDGTDAVAAAARDLGLRVGDPARAEPVLSAERRLLDRLLAAGHPLAVVAGRETVVNHDRREMAVVWRLAPGPAARFAAPDVEGAERVDAGSSGGTPRAAWKTSHTARTGWNGRGAACWRSAVRVGARPRGRTLDETGRLPTTFTVTDRARHAVGLSAAYETNYGPSVRAYWEHRNLLGGAERLRVEAEVARIGTGGLGRGDDLPRRRHLRDPGLFGRDLDAGGEPFRPPRTLGSLRPGRDHRHRAVSSSAFQSGCSCRRDRRRTSGAADRPTGGSRRTRSPA
jgi:translocation and assembly module TamA